VRCTEDDARGGIGFERFLPSGGAQAPAVAGLETWESKVRKRRREIIAARLREGQELGRDLDADGVKADMWQQPERKKPAIGLSEQISTGSPKTFLCSSDMTQLIQS